VKPRRLREILFPKWKVYRRVEALNWSWGLEYLTTLTGLVYSSKKLEYVPRKKDELLDTLGRSW